MQPENPIKFVRKNVFKVTQEELATIGGVSRSRVTRYESNDEPPPYAFMEKLRAEAKRRGLQFTGEWFFEVPPQDEAA